jgi:hypothetical protein
MDYVIANIGLSVILAFAAGFVVSLIACARAD